MIQQGPDTSSYSRFDFLDYNLGLPNGTVGKETACNARDTSLIPGSGRSHGGGNGNPLQYSCLFGSLKHSSKKLSRSKY